MASKESPLERAVLASFPWLVGGLTLAVPALLIPSSDDRRWDLLVHLAVLVAFSLGLAWRLAPFTEDHWFADHQWSEFRRYLVSATALIVIVTGVTALATLATSSALRFDPSLQFLQLLSALDIAWVVAGTAFAVRYLWGNKVAAIAGVAMSVVCVTSIALYLAEVGLTPTDGWLVDGDQMLRLVIPFDVAAAAMTIGFTVFAARRSADRAGQTPVV